MGKIQLRDYQSHVKDEIYKTYDKGIQRMLAVLATGLGKTFTTVFFILEQVRQGKKVLILVDQDELVWQWKKSILSADSNIKIGIEKAENKATKFDQVVIATVQTLGRKGVKRIKKFKSDHFKVCVVDEAHKSISDTFFRTLNYFGFGNKYFDDDNLLLGLTATPYRNSGEPLSALFDDIIVNFDIRYAIENGWLTDIVVHDVKTKTDISKVKTHKGDFSISSLSDAVNTDERNALALKAYKEISPGEPTLAYCASVEHAHFMAELFNQNGIPSAVIDASTDKKERKRFLAEYQAGEIKVLFNYNVLTTGVDLPETTTLMLLRPIKSKLLFTQTLGRALRPSKSALVDYCPDPECRHMNIDVSWKPFAKIIDFHDISGKHNIAHVPSLFGLNTNFKSKEKKKFFKEVVEPLEKIKHEKQIDISSVTSLEDVEMIVKSRNYKVTSYKTDPEIESFTDRSWIRVGKNNYEILYGSNNKTLTIEQNVSKLELIDKEEWNLVEFDMASGISRKLNTFNSLSGAFKIADEYADKQKWDKSFLKRQDWMKDGVTEAQLKLIERIFTYKTGHRAFELLNDRYPDTKVRKVRWKETGEILDRGSASRILDTKLKKK